MTDPATAQQSVAPRRGRRDIELLRCFAFLAIVTIHVTKTFVSRAETDGAFDTDYWIASAFDSAARWGVPIFFAIAGWVLLVGAPVRSREDLVRRASRAVVPLLVWGYLYVLFGWWEEGLPSGASDVVVSVVQPFVQAPEWGGQLWYMFVYIPLLLVLGTAVLVLRDRPISLGLLGFLGLAVALPSLLIVATDLYEPLGRLKSDWALAVYPFLYVLIGAHVLQRQSVTARTRVVAVALYVVFVAVTALSIRSQGRGETSSYSTYFTILASVGILVAMVGVKPPERLTGTVRTIGGATFGGYLIHQMLIWALWGREGALHATGGNGWDMVGQIVWSVALIYVLSIGLTLLWGRSGRLRRLLG